MQQEVVPMVKCTHTWAAVHGWRPCGEATKTTSPLAQVPNWHLACKLVWQSWGDGMGICSKWATNCLSFKGALYGWQRPHATKNVFGCLQRNISWLMTSDKTLLSKEVGSFFGFTKRLMVLCFLSIHQQLTRWVWFFTCWDMCKSQWNFLIIWLCHLALTQQANASSTSWAKVLWCTRPKSACLNNSTTLAICRNAVHSRIAMPAGKQMVCMK